jgi:hypothetical protein
VFRKLGIDTRYSWICNKEWLKLPKVGYATVGKKHSEKIVPDRRRRQGPHRAWGDRGELPGRPAPSPTHPAAPPLLAHGDLTAWCPQANIKTASPTVATKGGSVAKGTRSGGALATADALTSFKRRPTPPTVQQSDSALACQLPPHLSPSRSEMDKGFGGKSLAWLVRQVLEPNQTKLPNGAKDGIDALTRLLRDMRDEKAPRQPQPSRCA